MKKRGMVFVFVLSVLALLHTDTARAQCSNLIGGYDADAVTMGG